MYIRENLAIHYRPKPKRGHWAFRPIHLIKSRTYVLYPPLYHPFRAGVYSSIVIWQCYLVIRRLPQYTLHHCPCNKRFCIFMKLVCLAIFWHCIFSLCLWRITNSRYKNDVMLPIIFNKYYCLYKVRAFDMYTRNRYALSFYMPSKIIILFKYFHIRTRKSSTL